MTLLISFAFAIVSTATPLIVRAQSATLAAEFRPLLLARYAAIAHADTATLGSYLADDLSWIGIANAGADLSKPGLLALASVPQTPTPEYRVDSIRARRSGDMAIVEYQRSDHRRVGSAEQTTVVRAQEVFVKRGGKWLLELHTQSWVVIPVTPVAIDSVTLQAFVGRYQAAPGFVDNVHWEAGHLVATATGEKVGARLVPVSASAFSPDGVAPLIVFERDSTGRVIGYVQGYPDGQVRRATRLP